MPVLIECVQAHSPAARAGIRPGDTLLSIDNHEIGDVLDYRFYMTNPRVHLSLLRGGKPFSCDIRKKEYDDLGLEFETYLMDRQQSCKNKCIFCFIDQMPPGMRDTLYFKDDDSRLSFLFGNYITLTNVTDADIDRIIKMHISPVNISVHTTDPELRVKMMKNPAAAGSLRYLPRLTQAGIRVNTQLVLVPGWNDGPALEKSLRDLGALGPNLQTVSCVPVGMTKYRQGLETLRSFDREGALETISIIHRFADEMEQTRGVRVAYPSDEFFLLAGLETPPSAYYGDFDQLENGVGLVSMLRDDFRLAMADGQETAESAVFTMVTGVAAYPLIQGLAQQVTARHPNVQIRVKAIANNFFGPKITVAGLITGQDIVEQLRGEALGERVLFPAVMLRREGDRFLDDMTVEQLSEKLGVPAFPVENDGWELYDAMTGKRPG